MTDRRSVPYLLNLIVTLAFAAFLLFVVGDVQSGALSTANLLTITGLASGVFLAGTVAINHVQTLCGIYLQDFHDLSEDDAYELAYRLLFGFRIGQPKGPVLRVKAGHTDLGGPPVVHKVGGPALLSVDHDNAVVTSRLGRLHRVLGPGSYDLDPYERVWDVIDLRPQRRTLTVEFMSREGIPAACQVSIVCRAAIPKEFFPSSPDEMPGGLAGYARRTALLLATSRYVRRLEGTDRATDWVAGIVNGKLDGTVRDTLEQYSLNELVNPQHWLDADEGEPRIATKPKLLTELEDVILDDVRETAKRRGIIVESIGVGPIQPDEEAISRQWLQFWQARLQRKVDDYTMAVELTQEETVATARAEVQADFVKRVIQQVETLREKGQKVPDYLVLESVSEVLNSMYDWSPDVRRALFQQGESMLRFVQTLLYGPTVVARGNSGVAGEPTGSQPSNDTPSSIR
ncbi:MAG: SPFH domain-containing protein [Anaerolineae bacterium]